MQSSAMAKSADKGAPSMANARKAGTARKTLEHKSTPVMDLIRNIAPIGERPSVDEAAMQLADMPLLRRQIAANFIQRTYGNSFMQRMAIQAKLKVGRPDDEYEREADRVAEQAMNMSELRVQRASPKCDEEEALQTHLAPQITPLVQKQVEPHEEEEEEKIQAKRPAEQIIPLVQRQAGPDEMEDEAGHDLEESLRKPKENDKLLADGVRARMESIFGVDFSSVRIHSDEQADRLNRSIRARAFTRGQDIFFRRGEYCPESLEGQRLIAHELAHVVQQSSKMSRSESHPVRFDQFTDSRETEALNVSNLLKNQRTMRITGHPMDTQIHLQRVPLVEKEILGVKKAPGMACQNTCDYAYRRDAEIARATGDMEALRKAEVEHDACIKGCQTEVGKIEELQPKTIKPGRLYIVNQALKRLWRRLFGK